MATPEANNLKVTRNYCTPEGGCTCKNQNEELVCTQRGNSECYPGLCIWRAWFEDTCMSLIARLDAKKQQEGKSDARP